MPQSSGKGDAMQYRTCGILEVWGRELKKPDQDGTEPGRISNSEKKPEEPGLDNKPKNGS